MKSVVGFLCLTFVTLVTAQEYTVPEPRIEALHPKGLRVSIPDSDGVQLFAFHGNVNRPLYQLEAGEMSVDVTRKTNGRWTYINSQKRLKVGDVINYWLYVQRDGLGYRLDDQTFEITKLIGQPSGIVETTTSTILNSYDNGNVNRPSQTTLNRPQNGPERPHTTGYRPTPSDGHRPPPDEYRPPPDEYRPPPDEYRPPPDEYRPPPDEYRPPPDVYRPPPDEYRPPTHVYRPPSNNYRPPPEEYRPPPDEYRPRPPDEYRPPAENHRPPPEESPEAPPPEEYRPPPHDHRPPPNGYRPPPDEPRPTYAPVRPPPPPPDKYRPPLDESRPRPPSNTYRPSTDEYRPPSDVYHHTTTQKAPSFPANSRPTSSGDIYQPSLNPETSNHVHHNHHVGFAGSNNGATDRYPSRPVYSSGSGNLSRPSFIEGTTPNSLTSDRFSVPPKPEGNCELSATTVNGKPACKGQVVFDENWTTLNLRRWKHEVKISGHPDFEFCVYAQHPENSWVKSGQLHLKPTLLNDKYGPDFVRKGKLQLDDCTAGPPNSDSCWREAMFSYILPPTLAARLHSKESFSFKYGKIEVRAKLPIGDWIYPELWLQPRNEDYGPGLSSGRIILAMARGNPDLRGAKGQGQGKGEDLSAKNLVAGALAGGKGVGSAKARRKIFTKHSQRGFWADQFHNYTLLWTPDTLAFSVDGVELGVATPELGSEDGALLRAPFGEDEEPWSRVGSKLAPFDKEFFISLGVAVGGVHAFPDGCESNGFVKPWKNTGAKAMLDFWNAKDRWYSTWSERSQLLVESVRVTALNN